MILPDAAVLRNLEHGTLFYEAVVAPEPETSDDELHFAFGYPSALSDLTCSDKIEALDMSQVHVDGTWVPPRAADDLHGLKVNLGPIMKQRCNGDFNGFSGGPVFSIHVERKVVEFRGIIIRAGNGSLFYAPAGWIDALCDGDRCESNPAAEHSCPRPVTGNAATMPDTSRQGAALALLFVGAIVGAIGGNRLR